MVTNYIFMKKANGYLLQLNKDRRAVCFCLAILVINLFYLWKNDDRLILIGYGYGLDPILEKSSEHLVVNTKPFILRGVSFLVNIVFFNFLVLMLYSLIFKLKSSANIEILFVYIINIFLLIAIFCFLVFFK